MDRKTHEAAKEKALAFFDKANIVLTPQERETVEVADLGLGELDKTGIEIVTYVNTARCCAKELVLFPGQTCPEHRHPPSEEGPGKEETFRCRYGEVFLYVEGDTTENCGAKPPAGDEAHYTVFHEVHLFPGQQYTLLPNTRHWFQAGSQGAVVSEFSTRSNDETDIYTDPRIKRVPVVE